MKKHERMLIDMTEREQEAILAIKTVADIKTKLVAKWDDT
jgi:hypothetical protein